MVDARYALCTFSVIKVLERPQQKEGAAQEAQVFYFYVFDKTLSLLSELCWPQNAAAC